jgi:hypothetical protein
MVPQVDTDLESEAMLLLVHLLVPLANGSTVRKEVIY